MSMEGHRAPHVMESKEYIKLLKAHCITDHWNVVLYWTEYVILILGILANVSLLWLFLREVKLLTASKVFGLNLAVMGLLYLAILPITLIYEAAAIHMQGNKTSGHDAFDSIFMTKDIFNMFNMIGCPLLLTCMCIERYLAVMQPVLYLRLSKWKNVNAVSAVVWVITFVYCSGAVFADPNTIAVFVSITSSALFLVMLSCLAVVVWSLWQKSPAHTNQSQSRSSIKKQAVANVLFVVLPTVTIYLPTVVMIPLLMYIFTTGEFHVSICLILEFCTLIPRFGVLIGPTFYLAKARQMFCIKGNRKM